MSCKNRFIQISGALCGKVGRFVLPLLMLGVVSANCQESPPACTGDDQTKWDGCIGVNSIGGDSYRGAFRKGQREGDGRLIAQDGSIYTGEFAANQKNGMGVIKYPNGETYAGEFRDDFINGSGTYLWPNGDKYSGGFVAQLRSGFGVQSTPFGEIKIGEFGNGDYLGPPQKPFVSESEVAAPESIMMGEGRHGLGVSKLVALSALLTLAFFLFDCWVYPPYAALEHTKRQSKRSWLFIMLTMIGSGAALLLSAEILIREPSDNVKATQSSETDRPDPTPM